MCYGRITVSVGRPQKPACVFNSGVIMAWRADLSHERPARFLFRDRRSHMSLESNKAIVRSYFERAVNQGDLAWLEQIIAPGFGAGGSNAHPSGLAGPALARQAVQ